MALRVTPAIPASQIVQINPSVLSAGGSALDLIGLMLTTSTRPPIGQVLSFSDANDIEDYFGSLSQEAALANIYFLGPDNSTAKPAALLYAQYAYSAVAAYVRGGDLSGISLATLQGYSGSLAVTIDAVLKNANISLSAATSFSNAAEIIGAALAIRGATENATFTGAISGTTLTVSAVASGTLSAAGVVSGSSVTGVPYIVQQLGGTTGNTGTYQLSTSQVAGTQSMVLYSPGVVYDSISGAFTILSSTTGNSSSITYASGTLAGQLLLTQAGGAVLSQGTAAASPVDFMDGITQITQNWAEFMTLWEPSDSDKESFATWTNNQNNRYVYEMWETNIVDTESGGPSAPVLFVTGGNLSGISLIWEDPDIDTVGGELAAFQMGWTASLDFTRLNGRSTAAFKHQTGLQPQVFSATTADNLIGAGMNFYGDYTTANDAFLWYYPGSISGPFLWKDSYVNQIWLNNQLQLAMMTLLDNVNSIPYNQAGYALISAAAQDPINAAVNFGAIRAGVQLSAQQKAIVNSQAGLDISDVLFQRGWYFQVVPATAQVRAARGSPPCTLWYTDGQSVQRLVIASIEIQ